MQLNLTEKKEAFAQLFFMKLTRTIYLILFIFISLSANSQLTNGVTGLLHMPNADMQKSGTFFLGSNYLNEKNIRWGYSTYNYYFNITIFPCFEVSYVCTLFKTLPSEKWPSKYWNKFTNQDRHFVARLRIIKEEQFGLYMPAIVLGVSDPTTGAFGDYTNLSGVNGRSNGYFNVWYIAVSKHINTKYGNLGAHLTYMYNKRTDYPLNGPAVGFDFKTNFIKGLDVIAEYDAKTINIGAIYSLYHDHFNFLLELQKCKYISCGVTYKVNLLGGNHWRKEKTQSNEL